MQSICPKNQKMLNHLNGLYKDITNPKVLKHTKNNIEYRHDKLDSQHYPTSIEYLNYAIENLPVENYAFPRASICSSRDAIKLGLAEFNCDSNFKKLKASLGVEHVAVVTYYPKGGYMGWHHNCNAPGYNILFSHSVSGNGYFKYRNPKTKKIVTMTDTPGWNVKVGNFDAGKNNENLFWHTAWTGEPRITVAFVLNEKDIWLNMIEDITMGELDIKSLDEY